jgi:hypothetical protein
MDGDVGAWHVASVRKGMGRTSEVVYYVQRYVRPQEGRRYNGDVATRTWDDFDVAQKAADDANEGRVSFNIRGTYL